MRAQDIAALITAGIQPAGGDQDIALHTGVIKSWDRQTGVNTVDVNGTTLTNLDSLQGGIPNTYAAGDVVLVARKQSRWFILGKVASAIGSAGSAPRGETSNANQRIVTGQVTADWQAFAGDPILTPTIPVYIGSNRAAMVYWTATVKCDRAWGEVGFQVVGPTTTFLPGSLTATTAYFEQWHNSQGFNDVDGTATVTGSYLMGNSVLTSSGLHTFSMRVRGQGNHPDAEVTIRRPSLSVIPL